MITIKNIWVLVYLALIFFGAFIHITKDGEPQGKYSAGVGIIALITQLVILYNAGFFQ